MLQRNIYPLVFDLITCSKIQKINFCQTSNFKPFIVRRTFYTSSRVFSTSDSYTFNHLHDHFRISNKETAEYLVNHFTPKERSLLLGVLEEKVKEDPGQIVVDSRLSISQIKQLFIINTLPFIGFGLLDNMIMILAGEYIDQSLGAFLCISTMAAAALGNIISDLAGVGLAHYVEIMVNYFGFKHPVLTSEQSESKRARFTINMARAFGLTIGCLIGMWPLLFFNKEGSAQKSDSLKSP